MINNYIKHLRDREYMSGVEREKNRVKATGEVFTPTPLVREILNQLDPALFTDDTKTFIDPSCGDSQFLSEVLIRKLENGHSLEQALSTIYGVDLMMDNVKLSRDRLLCGHEEYRHIVEANILNGNTLEPLAELPDQTPQDRARMKELFYQSEGDKQANQLLDTGLFEIGE